MKATKARTYWDEASWPWQAAAILVAVDFAGLAVARFAVGWGMTGWPSLADVGQGPLMAIAGNWSIITRALLVLVFASFYYGRGVPPRAFGLTMSGFRKRLAEFWRCLGVVLPLSAAAILLLILLFRAMGRREWIAPPFPVHAPGDALKWILIFVVALPPLEELLYRGVVHPALRGRMSVGAALGVGSAVFGILHGFYGVPVGFLPCYAAAGLILAWVYERTGSLFFPWLLHAGANLAAVWLSSYPGLYEALRT